jgi:hypothetical protein
MVEHAPDNFASGGGGAGGAGAVGATAVGTGTTSGRVLEELVLLLQLLVHLLQEQVVVEVLIPMELLVRV